MISWKRGAALGPREKSCWVRRGASALQNRIMPKLRHNLVSFKIMLGTSPVAQWLRLHLPVQGLWVRSLGHAAKIPHTLGPKNKTSSRSNIVTNSINTKNGKKKKKKKKRKEKKERKKERKEKIILNKQ